MPDTDMSRRLPPLNGLRAVEATARHLSFSKAAEELAVTPAAVSQQVKLIEDYYGVRLFTRLTRALRLTDAGQAALPPLREGFDKLAEAAQRLRAHDETGIITVSVAPSFGAKWLVPRLHRFRAAHPEYDLRIDAIDDLVTFEEDDVDVALRYGRGVYEGLRAECLMSDITVPVCSPVLLGGPHPIVTPDDLRYHTLLHVQWRMEKDAAPNWRMWLLAAGVSDIDTERGPRFNADSLAVEAALEGQGVELASAPLVQRDLRAGRLVQPFPPEITQAMAFGYYLVYPETRADTPKVAAFRGWVMDELARGDSDSDP
jgi:LysR family glycine cleavage system transcriptional activator